MYVYVRMMYVCMYVYGIYQSGLQAVVAQIIQQWLSPNRNSNDPAGVHSTGLATLVGLQYILNV